MKVVILVHDSHALTCHNFPRENALDHGIQRLAPVAAAAEANSTKGTEAQQENQRNKAFHLNHQQTYFVGTLALHASCFVFHWHHIIPWFFTQPPNQFNSGLRKWSWKVACVLPPTEVDILTEQ